MKFKTTLLASTLVAAGSTLLSGCGGDDDKPKFQFVQPEKEQHIPAAMHKEEPHDNGGKHAAHWSYSGAGAPHRWGMLKDEFGTCRSGKSQSPIDISTVTLGELPAIEIDYQASPLEVTNNGHTIKVSYAPGSSIRVGDKKYELLQFHFHSPSEHTVGGKAYDMVAHLVHQADDGQLGVIGVLMKTGKPNFMIQQIWKHMPEQSNASNTVEELKLNVANLLPKNMSYYNYSGSLTTPPCSEGVNWMVLANPVEVSAAQVKRFTDLFTLSVRPVQPLNGRVVRASN